MFGKKKVSSSSRYSRQDSDLWEDEETAGASSQRRMTDDSYGVRDSYERQASYGRPDGYYDGGADEYYDDGTGAGYDDGADAGYDDGADGYYEEGPDDYGQDGYEDGGYDPDGYGADERDLREYAPQDEVEYYEPSYEETDSVKGKKRNTRKGRKKKSKAGFIAKLVLLAAAALALFLFWRFSRMDRVHLTDITTNTGVTQTSGYQDFVIYGVDSREGKLTEEAHSDTIIICSINKSTSEIKMVSVYRDTYLDNTNGEYRKATECYYFGGPQRSINMLNKNLDLAIEDYVTVDFNAVIDAVDLIGGVDIDVTEEELPYINGYQDENSLVTGAEITPVESAGYQHLNGIQALAYCRIRYTAGSDYKRTERQRAVLTQIFEKAKQQGVTVLAQLIDQLLPEISTSFSNTELLSLASGISSYTLGESTGFPFDLQAANISAGDCVVPVNLANNVVQLHAFLYGDTGYTVSDTVQEISDTIASTTGIYG